MPLSNNEVLAPFLSKPMDFIKGVDPLGLQNTSEATFALLLPGLNNVTGRIRFYSFYCWLLQEYAKRIGNTDPVEQRRFIRKAELIIALVNRSTENEVGAIPGSLYANRQLKEEYKVHDLESGTYSEDGTTDNTYWKNPGGAFGQYYLGALFSIGIIIEREHNASVYVRTQRSDNGAVSGEDLADAFDMNTTAENKALFFGCIAKGKIKTADLDILFSNFNMSDIPKKSEEQRLLWAMLIQRDFPLHLDEESVTFRRQTIKQILEFAKNDHLTDRAFTSHAYNNKGRVNNVNDPCLTGWYYYQLNEYWQYACLGILNGILAYLENEVGNGWKSLYQLVDEVAKETFNYLNDENIGSGDDEELVEIIIGKGASWDNETELFRLVKDGEKINRIAYSVLLIFSIYRNNLVHLGRLKEFGAGRNVERDGDPVTHFLKFENCLKSPIGDFLKAFFLKNVIYRHQFVAFRKMGSRSESTQLFIIEDGLIRSLGKNFEPTLTGPRIARLIRFLSDLGILSEDAVPTQNGLSLLNRLIDESN